MAGKGGGAWKVAYADFVTAMMAFFMVMWITAQAKPVKEAVAQYFKDPFGTSQKPSGPLSVLPAGKSLDAPPPKQAVKGRKGPGRGPGSTDPKATAKTTRPGFGVDDPTGFALHDGNNRMEGGVIQFAVDSAELSDEAKADLKRLAPVLVGKPNKIEIRGHTSQRPLPPDSPFRNPWQLSFARCTAAMDLLVAEGVERERIRLSQAGPFEPRTIQEQFESQLRNSRVEVYMLGELTEDLMGTAAERAQRFKTPKGAAKNDDGEKPEAKKPGPHE